MKGKKVNISKYQQISGDVWKVFKKYHEDGACLDDFPKDVHVIDQKYKNDDCYTFMQKLFKVYFDELVELKGNTNESD